MINIKVHIFGKRSGQDVAATLFSRKVLKINELGGLKIFPAPARDVERLE
jgi:hypothetical protein